MRTWSLCNQNYKLKPWINEMVWGQSQKIENSNGDTSHEYMTVTWKL